MNPTHVIWAGLYTLLTVVLMFGTALAVGHGRNRYRVPAPATTGHPSFERLFRVQMNTLEAAALFLPVLWIDALFGTSQVLIWAGVIWLAGRVLFAVGYAIEASKRSLGFGLSTTAWSILFIDAAAGLIKATHLLGSS